MFNAWGEKISFFLRFVIFWCNRQNFGPKSGGGVYHVIIGISDFGPKQGGGVFIRGGGVWYERDGNFFFGVARSLHDFLR